MWLFIELRRVDSRGQGCLMIHQLFSGLSSIATAENWEVEYDLSNQLTSSRASCMAAG